jgi:hypothetical protein
VTALHRALRTTACFVGISVAGSLAIPALAAPAFASPKAGKSAAKAAEKAQKDAEKAARKAQKAAAKAARVQTQPLVVVQPVQVQVPPTVSVPATIVVPSQKHCSDELSKLTSRRAQLEAEVAGLTTAEASARSGGRVFEADFLRLEIARVQKEQAKVNFDLLKKQTECAGVPVQVVTVTVPPVSVPAVVVPTPTVQVPATPPCHGAKGRLNSYLRQIRSASRHAAHDLAESIRARSRGELTKADKKLAEATRQQQRVALLTVRRNALAAACPASV